MTGDEILDSGVQVMAQPPGKRMRRYICCPAAKKP
jgi:chromosome segregation ATPase